MKYQVAMAAAKKTSPICQKQMPAGKVTLGKFVQM
jgi:hypothetical protein